jgi:L-ectoine synthase
MIVRKLEDLIGTERDVDAPTFHSRRLILARDGVDFSLHDTILFAGSETRMWYRNHVEAVYCIRGTGTLTDLETGATYDVAPGTMYVLDKHDRHVLRAETELQMVCVFTPPLTGREVHDQDGVYPLLTEETAPVAAGD